MAATTTKTTKQSFRVIGFAEALNQADIEVNVKAENATKAREQASAENAALKECKTVRVYRKRTEWVRCA